MTVDPVLVRYDRHPAARRGSALAEVVVAAAVLAVGVLGVLGALGGAATVARLARTDRDAAARLARREAMWRGAPCTPAAGDSTAGALRERWTVVRAGSTGMLTDTVVVAAAAGRKVGIVAVAWCGP